jgi:hypothetical protein
MCGLAVFAAISLMTGCSNPFELPASSGGTGGKGYVTISLNAGENPVSQAAARTLLPSSFSFDSCDLKFTKDAAVVEKAGWNLNNPVELETGIWALELKAYMGTGAGKTLAASGLSPSISVTQDTTTPVTVHIAFVSLFGTGSLDYAISNSGGITPAAAKIVLKRLDTTAADIEIDLLAGGYTGIKSPIASGYYLATVILETRINGNPDKKAVWSDQVNIYENQTTNFVYDFIDANFHRVIEHIWIVGTMNSWQLPGTEMSKESNGIFTWAGDVNIDDTFRFSLTDTGGWAPGTEWKGDWFAPAVNDSLVGAAVYDMEFISEYKGANNAWKFSGAAYYLITIDTGALRMTAAKPVIVTGLTINGGDTSAAKGSTKTFSATVNGHNVTNQGVTWALAGNEHAETKIDANTGELFIHSAETAASLSVTAASVVDTTVSGSVTVTVTGKTPLAAVSKPGLSGGIASWSGISDETHVLAYTVQLYKDGSSAGAAGTIAKGQTYSHDFRSLIIGAGSGDYTVRVTAAAADPGDGQYADSNPSAASDIQTVIWSDIAQYTWAGGNSYTLTENANLASGGFVIPAGMTLIIDSSKSFTAGSLTLAAGVWKASGAAVTITPNTITLGDHSSPGFGNGDGGQSAVLTGSSAGTNTFTVSGGAITLGQSGSGGHSLTVTGTSVSSLLSLGADARIFIKAGEGLMIQSATLVTGDYLDIGPGEWKATAANAHFAANNISLYDALGARLGKDDGNAATVLAGPFEPGKAVDATTYTASGAKLTLGQNGNALTITGDSPAATLSAGATAGFWVKAGLTLSTAILDMSTDNDWCGAIYLAGTPGITLANSNSVLLFNNDAEGGGTYPLAYNSPDIHAKITIGSSVVVKAIWNDAWKNGGPHNERFASFTGASSDNAIERSEAEIIWLTKRLKFKD